MCLPPTPYTLRHHVNDIYFSFTTGVYMHEDYSALRNGTSFRTAFVVFLFSSFMVGNMDFHCGDSVVPECQRPQTNRNSSRSTVNLR